MRRWRRAPARDSRFFSNWAARSANSARESRAARTKSFSTCGASCSAVSAASKNNSASWLERDSERSRALNVSRRSATTLSRTTCALMPPKPIALTLARSGRSPGQSSASRNTRNAGDGPPKCGCGCSQPVVGGSTCVWTAIVALIKPATPGGGFRVADVCLD